MIFEEDEFSPLDEDDGVDGIVETEETPAKFDAKVEQKIKPLTFADVSLLSGGKDHLGISRFRLISVQTGRLIKLSQ